VAHGGYAALDRTAQREMGTLTTEPLTRSLELGDVRLGTGSSSSARERNRPRRAPAQRPPAASVHAGFAARSSRWAVRHSTIDESGVRLDVVGSGTLTSLVPFGAGGLATQSSAGGVRPEPVLLSSSIRGLASLPPLRLFPAQLRLDSARSTRTTRTWDIDRRLLRRGSR
jgi:hypothetical protein